MFSFSCLEIKTMKSEKTYSQLDLGQLLALTANEC